jgi:segregation and condensation protein A
MPLNIKLENFEGPFDLLLHLIKKNKMDIYDIRIHDITAQYLEYIRAMEVLDLEVTSEFIVIAATLIEIKSRLLLPKSPGAEDNEDSAEDTAEALLSKLAQYKRYKTASEYLKGRFDGNGAMYSKKAEIIEAAAKEVNPSDYLGKITMTDLFNLYFNVITLQDEKMNQNTTFRREIPIEKFKVEEKMEQILSKISVSKRMKFTAFMSECSSKNEAITVFLALLELIKLRNLTVFQESSFSDIYIQEVVPNEGN